MGQQTETKTCCAMFMLDGGIFCASRADSSATSSVSQVALLLPAVGSEAFALTFHSVQLLSESTEDMILQVVQQNNHSCLYLSFKLLCV